MDLDRGRIVERLRSVSGLRFVALFGSVASGQSAPGSDIDIAVSIDRGTKLDFNDQVALAAELSHITGRDVDLVHLDEAGTVLRWEVARKGRMLWERAPGVFTQFRIAAAWEYEDFAPVLAICRRGFLASLQRPGSANARR